MSPGLPQHPRRISAVNSLPSVSSSARRKEAERMPAQRPEPYLRRARGIESGKKVMWETYWKPLNEMQAAEIIFRSRASRQAKPSGRDYVYPWILRYDLQFRNSRCRGAPPVQAK